MEKRAKKLGQIRRRLKQGSSTATQMGPEERAVEVKREREPAAADRAATRREARRIEELRDEARYRRERLELYRARLYGGRSPNMSRLRELERSSEGASARLSRAEAKAAARDEPSGD
jgi:hypothetical protein